MPIYTQNLEKIMHKDEYSVLDGLGLAQLIRQGEVSAQEALATAKSLLQEKKSVPQRHGVIHGYPSNKVY